MYQFNDENDYLNLLRSLLSCKEVQIDRTEVGSSVIFGAMLRFDLSGGRVPLMTTKRVAWKSSLKEMLWFLKGETNVRSLLKEGVTIWTDWPLKRYRQETGETISQREFEQRILNDEAFSKEWGELGPIYGKQWRKWSAPEGEIDQIATVIQTLKTSPTSRRILFHAWNVAELNQMVLPPCHCVYQFHRSNDGRLHCFLFQRSCDLFLGAPFNFFGASALTHMIAQQTQCTPGSLVWSVSHCHLYLNHREQAQTQCQRKPYVFPKLRLLEHPNTIDDYSFEQFSLEEYQHHDMIPAEIAV